MAECGGEDLVLGRVIGELMAERQAGNPLSYLDEVRIRDGQVFMRDDRLGLSWAAPAAEISLRRDVAGLAGDISLGFAGRGDPATLDRSEEHTSELQSLMRISYAVFCLKKK